MCSRKNILKPLRRSQQFKRIVITSLSLLIPGAFFFSGMAIAMPTDMINMPTARLLPDWLATLRVFNQMERMK